MPLAFIPSPSQGVWYLGFIPIRAYALCIVLGVIFAVWLSERRWRARGGEKGTIVDIAVPAVIFGLIGGRLYHVITDWQTYFGPRAIKKPIEALFIWEGGLGIWGAVALGGVGVWWACRRRGISISAVADTVAPGIAFAQAIGRWGNWFNQELYGGPTTLPWGLEIDPAHRLAGYENVATYHPTFLYESIWDLLLGLALLWIGRQFTLRHGRLFALYVAGYTLGRFWIEGLRIDPVGGVDHAVSFLGLRINQWTSIVLFVGALVFFFLTRNKQTEEIIVPASAAVSGEDSVDPAHPADQADATDATESEESAAEAVPKETSEEPVEVPEAEAVQEESSEAPEAEAVPEEAPEAEAVPEEAPEAEAVQEKSSDAAAEEKNAR